MGWISKITSSSKQPDSSTVASANQEESTISSPTTVGAFEKENGAKVTKPSAPEIGSEKGTIEASTPGALEDTANDLARSDSRATTSTNDVPGADDESKYMTGLPLFFLTTGLVMATFCIALDNTILATAIPNITSVFNSLDDVGWYGSSYLLTTSSLQPSFGRIYQYFSIKWTYITALAIFEIGSVICGAAINSPMLIIGRAIAGVGAAALFSGGMTMVAHAVPLRKRPIYIGLMSSLFGVASVVGPILGGAFTDRVSWRWCFYINLPLGVITIVTISLFFQDPDRQETKMSFWEKIHHIDMLGAFLLIASIVCLLLALQWGGTTYAWSNSKVWGCLLGFGILIALFTGVQLKLGDRATIPPRILLKQRTVFACALFSALLAMALYTHIYYLPFYFQAVKGTSAEGSGIRSIPYLVSNTIASVVVGGSITVWGPYVPFTYIGSAIFCVGSGMLYTLKVDSGAGKWIGYQVLAGLGAGSCVQIPFIAVQVVLKKKDIPVGNSVAIFFNTLGGAIAVSIAQNIFSNKLVQNLEKYAPEINPWTIIIAGATHVREITPEASLPGVLHAYNIALTDAFILSIACTTAAFVVCFLFEWKSVKGHNLAMGGA